MALGVSLRRALTTTDLSCPAASLVNGERVRCGVEESILVAQTDPSTIDAFCTGCYEDCPSWRKEKEAVAARKKGALAALRAATPHQGNSVDLWERQDRARWLLKSNAPEARRFRARIVK